MLALRDKENLVHTHQTTAAAKPLNQGLRQLQPKTPGTRPSKTPYKIPLNDENGVPAFGKNTVKVKGAGVGNAQQSSKDAFVTPLGPRNRAPLGMKTTNAKANAFQTPGLQGDTLKAPKTNRKGSSLKKAKKVEPLVQPSQPQVSAKTEEDDVPDVEYAPPKPKELSDDPEEVTYNTNFPQFKGRNIIRGWERIYLHGDIGDDGLTDRERKFQQESVSYDKMIDEIIQKQVEDIELPGLNAREAQDLPSFDEPDQQRHNKANEKKGLNKGLSSLKARDAAKALSQTKCSLAKRVESTKVSTSRTSKAPLALIAPKRRTPTPTNSSTAHNTAAAASSRTTLGYSKGRSVSSTLQTKGNPAKEKQAPSRGILDPRKYMQLYGPPPAGSEMWMQCKEAGLVADPEEVDNDFVLSLDEEDEETRNFQLTL
ncbi:hypothetical protein BGW36DRAFT_294414 [Talaromyces proteolyticus]|uniref:Uncharacterized protein n=1 Tax=Talaromyces proteolyticus TaxID=1131652 RepID=A0AAD4KSD6_9EURO|nr:uncharacterized protein BGW36DRAFT_294414 [Talaromyces proteolyticus]KAH8698303.1 hypothetical protein BGW36DRAFT_294414 [Talaromyces proteolyticus]